MTDALIENPILNSPYEEPTRHWKFTEDGITNEIVEGRRVSAYFMPIAKPKKEAAQQLFPFDPPETGTIAVKVINHHRDEVLKTYDIA